MEGFADFLDDLLGGLGLVALSLALGGAIWGASILRPWQPDATLARKAAGRCISIIWAGALALALVQLIELAVKAWILATALSRSPFPAFLYTLHAEAGLARIIAALGLTAAATRLSRHPAAGRSWAIVIIAAMLVTASGAWLTHAAGRFDDRTQLMVVTTLHQLGAAVWVGSVIQLSALWHLTRRHPDLKELWPAMLARFSPLGMAAVLLLVATGSILAWSYVDSWLGLVGTAYGALIIAKIGLLALALGLAAMNFRAARRWRYGGDSGSVRTRVPYFVEAEIMVLVVILLAAVSLSSQPPAADIADQRASWTEVVEVFAPKWPTLESPAYAALGALAAPAPASGDSQTSLHSWSNYNHNVSGLFVLAMATLALLARFRGFSWARHWPLLLIVLAAFILLRSDVETWPLGPKGFWAGMLGDAEVLQHRLAFVVALALGVVEWRAQTVPVKRPWFPYAFPALCIMGSVLLLTHSHEAFELKSQYLIQISHTAMGLFGVFIACGRWLELQLAPPFGRRAGFVSAVAMFFIGLILLFYHEPA